MNTTMLLNRADSLMPITSNAVSAATNITAGRLMTPPGTRSDVVQRRIPGKRRLRPAGGDGDAGSLQEVDEVPRPTDGDRRGAKHVLEDEVPTDEPGNELAERRIRIGVCAPRDRDHGRELRVAESCEQTAKPGEHERQGHGRAGVRRCHRAGQDENTRPDDRADSERGEICRRQYAAEPAGAFTRAGFRLQRGDALRGP